jgi:hypothetical protein
MTSITPARLLGLALALLSSVATTHAGRFQERLAMLQERGFTVEAFRDQDQGLRVLLVTDPETGRQRMRGRYQDGRRFMARRPDEAAEWEIRGSEEGMEVPDVASMEPFELPAGGPGAADPRTDAGGLEGEQEGEAPAPGEEVTIPASE